MLYNFSFLLSVLKNKKNCLAKSFNCECLLKFGLSSVTLSCSVFIHSPRRIRKKSDRNRVST